MDHAEDLTARSRYVVEHGGWSSVGWSEDDPTADEALAALASLRRTDFSVAMESLRRSGEERLEALGEDRTSGDEPGA